MTGCFFQLLPRTYVPFSIMFVTSRSLPSRSLTGHVMRVADSGPTWSGSPSGNRPAKDHQPRAGWDIAQIRSSGLHVRFQRRESGCTCIGKPGTVSLVHPNKSQTLCHCSAENYSRCYWRFHLDSEGRWAPTKVNSVLGEASSGGAAPP